MRNFSFRLVASLLLIFLTSHIDAALVIEIDTDEANNANVAFNPNFAFGGDTTSASISIPGTAVGLTGGNSIFGGNGVAEPDTYLFTYTPGTDVDNRNFAAGTNLGNGNTSTGLTGGVSGEYVVYATWPTSSNINGGPTTFTLTGGGNTLFSFQIEQNNTGNAWFELGTANLVSGTTYTLAQTAGVNTFVSMRSSAAMFELVNAAPAAVPEPGTLILTSLCGLSYCCYSFRRGRKKASTAA